MQSDHSLHSQQTISTARLALRWPHVSDAQAIFSAYASDAEVTRYLTWRPHVKVDTLVDWLRSLEATRADRSTCHWAICTSADSEPVGLITLRLDGFKAELGYVLARSYWGRGFMPEAVRAVVELAIDAGLYRVAAYCDLENAQSARVMEKAGLRYEGVLRRYALHPNVSDEPRDVHLYAHCR